MLQNSFLVLLPALCIFFSEDGLDWLNKEFKFCKPLKTKDDVINFKSYLNDLWTNVAMMDYPYPTTFLMPLPGYPVHEVCKVIMARLTQDSPNEKNIVHAIAGGVNIYNNYTGNISKVFKIGLDHKHRLSY